MRENKSDGVQRVLDLEKKARSERERRKGEVKREGSLTKAATIHTYTLYPKVRTPACPMF